MKHFTLGNSSIIVRYSSIDLMSASMCINGLRCRTVTKSLSLIVIFKVKLLEFHCTKNQLNIETSFLACMTIRNMTSNCSEK